MEEESFLVMFGLCCFDESFYKQIRYLLARKGGEW